VTLDSRCASFLGSESNDGGTVAITANLTTGIQAIVVATGRPRVFSTLADTTAGYTALDGGGRISINNAGAIVFGADLVKPPLPNASGIFSGPDPRADKIIAVGDELFDSTVAGLPANFMNPRALNDVNQIVFRATLADGRTVLVRADPTCSG
jgi:hypothetical protein